MKEKTVQNNILEYLKFNQIKAWPNQSQGTFDAKRGRHRSVPQWFLRGVSDIIGILPDGKFLAIEVKRPAIKGIQTKGYASKEQKIFLEEISSRGGIGFLAYSIDDVKKHLKGYLVLE